MAAVQYTFTYRHYTEQHNETEYPERHIITIRTDKHNNKNTQYNNKRTLHRKEYTIDKIKQMHTKHMYNDTK